MSRRVSLPPGLTARIPPPPPNIFMASAHGNLNGVVDCIRAGQDIHGEDSGKQTPFFLACAFGRVELVKWFMNTFPVRVNHANINGFTPLQGAVSKSHVDVVRLLVQNEKVDVNHKNKRGNTALHIAIQNGNETIIQLLLDAKIDLSIENNKGDTAVYLTTLRHYDQFYSIVKPFIPKEPIINAVRHFENVETFRQEIQALLDAGTDINTAELDLNTALREALTSGTVDAVNVLLSFDSKELDNIYLFETVVDFTFPEKTFELHTECAISGVSPIPCPLRCLTEDAECGHVYDASSGIIQWIVDKNQCPLCRQKVEFIQVMSKEDVTRWNSMETKMQNAIELEKKIRESRDFKEASDDRKKELLQDLKKIKDENAFINRMYEHTPLQF